MTTKTPNTKPIAEWTPAEVDTVLADLQLRQLRNDLRLNRSILDIHDAAGTRVKPRTYGRRKEADVFTATLEEAIEIGTKLRREYVEATDYEARSREEISEWYATVYRNRVELHRVSGYQGDHLDRAVVALEECKAENEAIEAEAAPLVARYQAERWNRMYLVVSSAGHVHSSRYCQTCRSTTAFGWVPELSGMTEAEAMAELDSDRMPGATSEALCSVCYPNAPVAPKRVHITKAKAAKLSKGHLEV